MNEPDTCTTCRWSEPAIDEDEGPIMWCRRWPPQITSVYDPELPEAITWAWPPVREHDWCGEHTPSADPDRRDPQRRPYRGRAAGRTGPDDHRRRRFR